jgi:hypothetical protein
MNYQTRARLNFADAARQAYNVPRVVLPPHLQAWQSFRDGFVQSQQQGGLVTRAGERMQPNSQ